MGCYYNLAEYFYDVAKQHHMEAALLYRDEVFSYDDLNKLSNKIARYFLYLGTNTYDTVGIFNTKEPLGYAAMLACIKIGAIYTNIDEENPLVHLKKILFTCQPKLLVSDHSPSEIISKAADELGISMIDIGNEESWRRFDNNNLESSREIIGSTPAYIMFTSGSTGIPKGVTISHVNVLSFLNWSILRYGVTNEDRFAQVSPMYFDNSVFDFYTALFSGASLTPIKREITKDYLELVRFVDDMQCTIWFSVPSLLVYLLTMKVLNKNIFQNIRVITFGGEGFPKGELKKLYNLYGNRASLINVYGPTEGTCICSSYDITERDFEDMGGLAPLGTINPNFEYLIVDEDMQKVQRGEKGELCLVGPNVGIGYYNDPARTQNSFVQNPSSQTFRDIVYKTGDIVYEKEGLLWFAGRADNQVKHMGYRIELEEIEAALNGLKCISQSAVIYVRQSERYGKIVGFVVAKGGVDESQIKDDLYELLPDYMIPNVIEITDELPKSSNGKVDKKILKEIYENDG